MKKQIVVDLKTSAFLRDAFGCTRQAVWNALTFESNSDQAKKIRHLAIQKGGELVGASVEPETSHESDGTMVQTFGNRVKLIVLKGMVTVYVDGKPVEKTMCRKIPDFVNIQNRVKHIASEL